MPVGKPAKFYLDSSFKGRRTFGLDLHDPVFDPVFRYADATSPDRPIQDSIRELLLQAVATNAADGSIRAARLQAYREAQQAIAAEVPSFLNRLGERLAPKALGDSDGTQIGPQSHAVGEPA